MASVDDNDLAADLAKASNEGSDTESLRRSIIDPVTLQPMEVVMLCLGGTIGMGLFLEAEDPLASTAQPEAKDAEIAAHGSKPQST